MTNAKDKEAMLPVIRTTNERDLCVAVFVAHILTLPAVAYDYFVAKGTKAFTASLTIGFGAAATLGQTALVAILGGISRGPVPVLALVFQSLAVAFMLAIIIADIRKFIGYKGNDYEMLTMRRR